MGERDEREGEVSMETTIFTELLASAVAAAVIAAGYVLTLIVGK